MIHAATSPDALRKAKQMDDRDPLAHYRSLYHMPKSEDGKPLIYFCGNSLGLQPKSVESDLNQELHDWKKLGVEGHFKGKHPWLEYHTDISQMMANIVGAMPHEVVLMNTLTVNLHLMMVSFYRPAGDRCKVLMESDAFPSDRYAVASHLASRGIDPEKCIVELKPRDGEYCLRTSDIVQAIEKHSGQLALILIGNSNYYTGQQFDMKEITRSCHQNDCMVGFDCAHGAGNLVLDLHDSGCDFAVWCTYKYLNSGPGSIAGCFVHERHSRSFDLPRYAGWWGHNRSTRFLMRDGFDPLPGAEGWQLSNPPILSMAPMRSSLRLFNEAGMDRLRDKSVKLTGFLYMLLEGMKNDRIKIITPGNPSERGCQLSICVENSKKDLFDAITNAGVVADWREPGVIRVSPTPMYNSFSEVYRFVEILKKVLV